MAEGAAFEPARPQIHVAGRHSGSLTAGLDSLRIHEGQDGLSSCEVTFGNWGPSNGRPGFLYFGRDQLEFGRDLRIALGGATLFAGRISAIEGRFPDGGPPQVTILAEDRLQDLRMTRRTRAFHDVRDADVCEQIASEHGLTSDVDVEGPVHRALAQLNQSDLAFLRERARSIGAELWIGDQTLHVTTRSRRDGGRLRIGYGNELTEFVVTADLADQRSGVTVTGWDMAGKQGLAERADDSTLSGEIAGGESGAAVLATALATREETVSHTQPLARDEAMARATAIHRRNARQFVRGHGTARSDARLRVGTTVQIDGVGPLFSGDYYLAETIHRFDATSGMRSDVTVERPTLGRAT